MKLSLSFVLLFNLQNLKPKYRSVCVKTKCTPHTTLQPVVCRVVFNSNNFKSCFLCDFISLWHYYRGTLADFLYSFVSGH